MRRRGSIDIFAEQELSSQLKGRLRKMGEEVREKNSEDFLYVDDEDYATELQKRWRMEQVQIHFDQTEVSSAEKMIPAEKHPKASFLVKAGESYPRQVIRYHIPFEGPEELLRSYPNPRLHWTQPVELDGCNICFDIVDFYSDASRLKTQYDGIVDKMRRQL